MHPEFTKALFGYAAAGASALAGFLAQMLPKDVEPWGQLGALGLLVYFLVYAVKHQNREKREVEAKLVKEQEKNELERRRLEQKWDDEHAVNLAARDEDRKTREKLALSVTALADALKK